MEVRFGLPSSFVTELETAAARGEVFGKVVRLVLTREPRTQLAGIIHDIYVVATFELASGVLVRLRSRVGEEWGDDSAITIESQRRGEALLEQLRAKSLALGLEVRGGEFHLTPESLGPRQATRMLAGLVKAGEALGHRSSAEVAEHFLPSSLPQGDRALSNLEIADLAEGLRLLAEDCTEEVEAVRAAKDPAGAEPFWAEKRRRCEALAAELEERTVALAIGGRRAG